MQQVLLQQIKKVIWRIKQFLRQIRKTQPKTPTYRSRFCMNWVIPGKLAVGGVPGPRDSQLLAQANIKVVLSLCANSEAALPENIAQGFRCLRLVLPDSHYKKEIQLDQLVAAVDVVRHSVQNSLPIYVHCLAGVERSPTVCIAYLCQYHNLELWEAVNFLKQVHPYSMPTESQLRAVRAFIQQSQQIKTIESFNL